MKKGFTLVEVLSVIVILGFLAAIIIPPILKTIDAAREESYDQLIVNIKEATQLYVRQHKEELEGINNIGNIVTIKFRDLVDSNTFKSPIIDPRNEKEISLDNDITILVGANNKYTITIGSVTYVE